MKGHSWNGRRKGEANPNYKDGLSKTKEYRKEFFRKHPEAKKQYSRYTYSKHQKLRDKEKSKPCMDCGIQYPPYVMHFDHRNGKEKLYNIGSIIGRKTLKIVKDEIAKCDVVCANCHAERTYKRRIQCAS